MINKNIAKIIKQVRNPYTELHLFRQEIDIHTTHQRPFTSHKKKVNTYRYFFAFFGLFYMFCAALIFYKMSAYTTNFLVGSYSFLVKNAACTFCVIASLVSLGAGIALNAEKEAAHFVYKRARRKLHDNYSYHLGKMGLKRFVLFGESRKGLLNFKEIYHDALDKLHHYKDETIALIERVIHAESLDAEKRELLLNHSLLEMEEKMTDVIHHFRSVKLLSL